MPSQVLEWKWQWGGRGNASDREGDVAVVLGNVAFQDVRAGTHDALEALPVQLHATQRALSHHRRRTRTIQQQCHLTYKAPRQK